MKEDIRNKLEVLFKTKRRIKTETELVYILVEIRKILDNSSETYRKKFPLVYFFCNWALHTKMDRTPAIKILRKFDEDIKNGKDIVEAYARLFSFIDFYIELRTFLNEQKLSIHWTYNTKTSSINDLMINILSHVPLENPTGYVRQFVIGKLSGKQGFGIAFVLADGKRIGWVFKEWKISKREFTKQARLKGWVVKAVH